MRIAGSSSRIGDILVDVGVPPHGAETRPWRTNGRRAEIAEYSASIPPSIAGLRISVSSATDRLCRQAALEVSLLERQFGRQVATLEPFMLRTEAIASSRIEEELTTVDQLARAEAGIPASRSARTVKGAIDSIVRLTDGAAEGITLESVLAAHAPLMANDREECFSAGTLRTVQNWIGGSNRSPQGALHVPPEPTRVPGLMADLLEFTARTDLDPIVESAIAHAQFESIHPFSDGNGRIGRALINAVWRYRLLTTSMAVPVASAIVVDRDAYFAHLDSYRAGAVEPFIVYLADCTVRASREAALSATRLLELPARWRAEHSWRSDSTAFALLDQLPQFPLVNADDVARLTGASTARVYRALHALEDRGILRRITESRRHMTWAAADVLDEAEIMLDRLRFSA